MSQKKLTIEVDYDSLARDGYGYEAVVSLIEKCFKVGVSKLIWSVGFAGTADYSSKILPRDVGSKKDVHSIKAAEIKRQFDPLSAAVELSHKYGIQVITYFRMFDDYWPGIIDKFIDSLPDGWWASRCGRFHLKGWPCYWLDEVRKYKLSIIREIVEYGVDGFMFGVTRSHSFYVCPYTQAHLFGYNQPVADEFLSRYGVDIRKFDYCKDCWTQNSDQNFPFLSGTEYIGEEPFDKAKWHMLKGESVTQFIREAREELGSNYHFALEASIYACPPVADADDPMPAKFFIDPAAMASESIIDEWVIPGVFKDIDFDSLILDNFKSVQDAGVSLNIWLNDIFSPSGGETGKWSLFDDIKAYIERFTRSSLDALTLHEAAFLLRHPDTERIWEVLKKYFG